MNDVIQGAVTPLVYILYDISIILHVFDLKGSERISSVTDSNC
jgi:hypothetical protein